MSVLRTSLMHETAAEVDARLDVDQLAQFRMLLDGPLAIVGSGGSFTAATLWAHLHETSGQAAWALTPYAFAQRSFPPGTRVLVLSYGGHHHDILRAARLSIERGHETRAATCRANSLLVDRVRQGSVADAVFVVGDPLHADDMMAVHAIVAFAVLAARLYVGAGPWPQCFAQPLDELPLGVPRFVVAFGAGVAEAAAVDFANKCQESGLAPAWQTDLRHFAHGQFMMLRSAREGALLVSFATRAERAFVERFAAALPAGARLHQIEAGSEGAAAALSLLSRSMRSFEQLVEAGAGAPTMQTLPPWGRPLYELEP